ncbi:MULTISPECIES: hypothetical protein [unclassified Halobacteriovorax]|uniref:hypothetical protein n=1 Tax=unclassified Halobacteriovorax TaxID=2639665 RepID=UPI0039995751
MGALLGCATGGLSSPSCKPKKPKFPGYGSPYDPDNPKEDEDPNTPIVPDTPDFGPDVPDKPEDGPTNPDKPDDEPKPSNNPIENPVCEGDNCIDTRNRDLINNTRDGNYNLYTIPAKIRLKPNDIQNDINKGSF